jgi:hypothetical protein
LANGTCQVVLTGLFVGKLQLKLANVPGKGGCGTSLHYGYWLPETTG